MTRNVGHSARRRTKDQEAADLVAKLLREGGNVICEKCSVPNWKVWHLPGKCPGSAPNSKGAP